MNVWKRARVLGFGAALLLPSACSSGPLSPAGLSLVIDSSSIQYDSSFGAVTVDLSFVIRNDRGQSVFYTVCGARLERRIGRTWITVWTPICALVIPRTEIPSGTQLAQSLHITKRVGENWAPPVDGMYRLVIGVSDDTIGGLTVPSSAFELST